MKQQTHTKDHNGGSPIDNWKSSEGQQTKKSTSNVGDGKSYQDQVSAFEGEGNIPPNQRIPSMKNINKYADRGLTEAKRAMNVSSVWIRENPALAIGVGLCLGFLFGSQIKKYVGSDSSRVL